MSERFTVMKSDGSGHETKILPLDHCSASSETPKEHISSLTRIDERCVTPGTF